MSGIQDAIIELKFVETNFFTRWPCTVCGGHTEKVNVLCEAEVDLGDRETCTIRVCENCIEKRDGLSIDQHLDLRARSLEGEARFVRSLISRLTVPAYAAWEEAELRKDCRDYLRQARYAALEREGYEPTDADLAAHRERRRQFAGAFGAPAATAAEASEAMDDERPFCTAVEPDELVAF